MENVKLALATRMDDELLLAPRPVIAGMAVLGQILLLRAVGWGSRSPWFEMQALGALCLVLAATSWLLDGYATTAGRWSTAVAMVVLIIAGHRWLGLPGALGLLSIPTALAVPMICIPAAAALALSETAYLALVPAVLAPGTSWATVSVALILIWTALALMVAVYRPIYRRGRQLELYTERAREALSEARDRKHELEDMRAHWLNASRQLRLANERLASLRLIAEEAKRSQAAFVANVSHEFRTPLNIITGLINVLVEAPEIIEGGLPPKALEYLRVVYRNSQHLTSMIDDVLDLSQIEARRMALRFSWTDLGSVAESASDAIRPLIEEKGLVFQLTVPDGLPKVYCDSVRIRQVILNLLSNAARLTERGSVAVDVIHRDRRVVFSVADTGPGIPPQDVDRIFEPFARPSAQLWRDKAGSGLGLSISNELVQLHGGRMRLETELGTGTTFYVELPVAGPLRHAAKPDSPVLADWIWREQSFRSGGPALTDSVPRPLVVVCDETAGLYPAFARYANGFEHVETRSLPQALEELRTCPARALVINAGSPDHLWRMMDTAKEEEPDTPVLGCCCPPPIERALEAGAVGYLIKPISRRALAEVMENSSGPVRRVLVVDDEEEVQELLTLFLRAHDEAIEVVAAGSGDEALEMIRDIRPDLVLLDVLMPGMDGWEVLATTREDITLRDTPVVMISGQDPNEGPITSTMLVATIGHGISLGKLLDCSRHLSMRLLQPD
jgi:signal transduction histidine kinase/CheY-like chemotaxis protein